MSNSLSKNKGGGSSAPPAPIATPTVAGRIIPADGLSVAGDGTTTVRAGGGLKISAGVLLVDEPAIDVTKLNKADTLVSGLYQTGLNGSSTLATLANAVKGNWWNVSAPVTISGQAFAVGDQLWCSANVNGTPANLTNFVRVPATTASATTLAAGIVQLAGDLGGSATAPSVLKVRGVSLPSAAPTVGQQLQAISATDSEWKSSFVGATIGRRNASSQSIPNSIADGTVVLFPDTDVPGASFGTGIGLTYDNATGRFTNTSGAPAVFLVSYQVIFPSGGTGWRSAWVRVSGTVTSRFAIDVQLTNPDTGMPLKGVCPIALSDGGYFQICANQNSGAAISIGGAAAGVIAGITTRIQITRMTQ